MSNRAELSRRSFIRLVGGVGASLMLGSFATASCEPNPVAAAKSTRAFVPNALIKVDPDGFVTITICRSEMGQGVRTSLALLAADEMDADWSKVRVTQAGAGPSFGEATGQGTGGSQSIMSQGRHMRELGATTRLMLIAAAAKEWNVDPSTCRTEKGVVYSADGSKSVPYGDLSASATAFPIPPGKIQLKAKADRKLIGKGLLRIDSPEIVTGKATYGIDAKVDGMVYAVIARPPDFGGSVDSFDDAAARKVDGVLDVRKCQSGVAVIGKHTWACIAGRNALKVTWKPGNLSDTSTETIRAKLKALEIDHQAMPAGAKVVSATYDLPYLAHATMEPMNCLADVKDGSCKVWVGTQNPHGAQGVAASVAGLQPSDVEVNVLLLGGGFGRRSDGDFVADAVELSKMIGKPVKCLWTREDDMKHDHYRPMAYHSMKGAIDADGKPVAWSHQNIQTQRPWRGGTASFGDAELVYQIPNAGKLSTGTECGIPTGAWRSVEFSVLNPAVECFIDELAVAAGKDPYEFRHSLLGDDLLRNVLEIAAKNGDWGKPLPKGSGRGIACFGSGWNTKVAHVVELSVEKGKIRVHRVVAAVDCGLVINPKGVQAMMMGGIGDGLSTSLGAGITIKNGGVVQNSWTDYPWLTMDQAPAVEIHVVDSDRDSGGMGEPPYPAVPPAVANAVFAATGKRVRRFPIKLDELV